MELLSSFYVKKKLTNKMFIEIEQLYTTLKR